ncbi:oligosaccharide repeat unit polymerase [Variovorax sp. W2I14]|uniref:oligosaccharide repeat unit polymerase n=1 Tax=Variovorax sp. W2I14 TaxID=3042290 RepID=UPI003D1F7171
MAKRFNSVWMLEPKNIIALLFFGQFILWLLFFPEVSSVENGEPKIWNFLSILFFCSATLVIVFGAFIGQISFRVASPPRIRPKTYYRFAIGSLLLSTVATLLKFQPILSDPAMLLLFLQPSGANMIYVAVSESDFGVASLQTLWVIPAIVFSFFLFSGVHKEFKYFKFFYSILLLDVLSVAAINSNRIAVINFMLVSAVVYVYLRRPRLRVGRVITAILAVLIVYWIGSLMRDGLVFADENNLSVLDPQVFLYIFKVFLEKYSVGELNNAFVIMEYVADPRNFAYATMFQRYFPADAPLRNINTLNVIGIWYWQFGFLLALVVALGFGFIVGALYRKSMHFANTRDISAFKLFYVLFYIGIFNILRVNYYFLQIFLVPFAVVCLFFVVNSLFNLRR